MKRNIFLIALLFFIISGVALKIIQDRILFPGFQAAQINAAEKDLQRCIQVLQRELEHLNTVCWDWASWDDTYAFMQDPHEGYIAANLVVPTFTDNRIHLIQFVSPSGEILWGKALDIRSGDPISIAALPEDRYPETSPLLFQAGSLVRRSHPFVTGFLPTEKEPMIVASRPILTSENQGPLRGSLIMGKLLDAEFIADLGGRILVDFDVMDRAEAEWSLRRLGVARTLLRSRNKVWYQTADGSLFADAVLADVRGDPTLLVRARIQPDLTQTGIETIRFADTVLLLCGAGITLLLLLVLQYTVVRPLSALTDYARKAKPSGTIGKPLHLDRSDEIGELADAWDGLLRQLAESEASLREANRKLQRDMAARERSEISIRRRENFYRTLMESMVNDVLVVDADHRIIDGNREDLATLGWKRDTVIGQTLEDLWSRLDPSAAGVDLAALLKGVLQSGEPAACRFEGKTKMQSPLLLDIRFSPIRSRGDTTHVLVSFGDVTRQVQMDRQLDHLQKIEALATLAAGISHEFNNILMSILLNVEAVLQQTDDPFGREALQISYESAMRARELVRQMRIFSRQEKAPAQPVEAHLMIKEFLKMMQSSLPFSIRIRTDLEAEDDKLWVPPGELQQILVNLCINAAHAMEGSEGEIRVRTEQRVVTDRKTENGHDVAPGSYLVLSVEETGKGMESRTASGVFDPFLPMKNAGQSAGMGLPVVHGIVSKRRGAVKIQSRPGRGTVVQVFLPQEDTAETSAAGPLAKTAGREEVAGGLRLLVVDDEEIVVSSLRRVLENAGYVVHCATDGKQALRLFREDVSAFDAVISDVAMPGMSGVELAEHLLSLRPDLPVLLCSGFQDVPDTEKLLRMGVRAVMEKPLNFDEIQAVIQEQFTGSS